MALEDELLFSLMVARNTILPPPFRLWTHAVHVSVKAPLALEELLFAPAQASRLLVESREQPVE